MLEIFKISGDRQHRISSVNQGLLICQVILIISIAIYILTVGEHISTLLLSLLVGVVIYFSTFRDYTFYLASNIVNRLYNENNYREIEDTLERSNQYIERQTFNKSGVDSPDINLVHHPSPFVLKTTYKRKENPVPDWNFFTITKDYFVYQCKKGFTHD